MVFFFTYSQKKHKKTCSLKKILTFANLFLSVKLHLKSFISKA